MIRNPLIPANAGTQIIWHWRCGPIITPLIGERRFTIWVPAFAGMSGVKGVWAHKLNRALLPLLALACIAASAGDPADRLANPAQEHRARALFAQIRCLVCQNESIDDSEAPLASDLRHIVRQQVAVGRSDADIEHFLVARYGEFVLMKPAFSPANALLWLTPFAIVVIGGATLLLRRRRGAETLETPLDADEEAHLRALRTPAADAL